MYCTFILTFWRSILTEGQYSNKYFHLHCNTAKDLREEIPVAKPAILPAYLLSTRNKTTIWILIKDRKLVGYLPNQMCNGLTVYLVAEVSLILVVTKMCFCFSSQHIPEQKNDQQNRIWLTMFLTFHRQSKEKLDMVNKLYFIQKEQFLPPK